IDGKIVAKLHAPADALVAILHDERLGSGVGDHQPEPRHGLIPVKGSLGSILSPCSPHEFLIELGPHDLSPFRSAPGKQLGRIGRKATEHKRKWKSPQPWHFLCLPEINGNERLGNGTLGNVPTWDMRLLATAK